MDFISLFTRMLNISLFLSCLGSIFFWELCLDLHPIFELGCLFSCLVCWVLYIFCILVVFQMYGFWKPFSSLYAATLPDDDILYCTEVFQLLVLVPVLSTVCLETLFLCQWIQDYSSFSLLSNSGCLVICWVLNPFGAEFCTGW